MKVETKGDLYALSCAVVCGLGTIFAKSGLADITTEIFNFYFFASAVIIAGISGSIRPKERREILQITKKAIGLIAILAVFFTFGLYFMMKSLKMIEPATVSFLSRIEVIVVIVLAYIFLKERLVPAEIIGGLVAIGGVLLLKYNTNIEISRASTMMLVSAFFFGLAEIIVKKYIVDLKTIPFLFYRNLFMVGIMYVLMLYQGQKLILPPRETMIQIFIAAMLLPVAGRATYLEALKRINVSRAALITQATPLMTALFALIMLGTLPTPIEWIGGGLIIGGVGAIKLSEIRIKERTL